jgi:hypothetical protein
VLSLELAWLQHVSAGIFIQAENNIMDNVILEVAVVAVHQFISAVFTLFFNVPTLYEQRLEKKWKREQMAYKRNCSIKCNTPTSRLKAKLSLLDVSADDNHTCTKLLICKPGIIFILAEWL